MLWSNTKKFAALSIVSFFIGAIVILSACKRAENKQPEQPVAIQPTAVSYVPLNFEPTPARIERGRYIVEGVAHCFMCHSEVDWSKPGAQPKQNKKGAGTRFPEEALSFLVAPNITPDKTTGAGDWSNETIARAIREGVGHDGRRLFPLMPYMNFRQMSDEDLVSVVSYIRTIKPVTNKLPNTKLPEEIKGVLPPPQPITGPVAAPDMGDMVKRGQYLVTLGNCAECHTPRSETGAPLPGLEFGGGGILDGPWGRVASANLTPDPSGIPYYDEALFIQTLRTGSVQARKLNSIMPWGYFRNMTDEDLKAIFAYLKTLKPVKHTVDNSETPTKCKVCGAMHGGGDRN
jgi:mono/diheme cytochrome c family protein